LEPDIVQTEFLISIFSTGSWKSLVVVKHEGTKKQKTLEFACNQYAQVYKYDVFQDRLISGCHSYLPFVFESFVSTSGDSHEFTKKSISSISTRLSEPKSVVATSFYES